MKKSRGWIAYGLMLMLFLALVSLSPVPAGADECAGIHYPEDDFLGIYDKCQAKAAEAACEDDPIGEACWCSQFIKEGFQCSPIAPEPAVDFGGSTGGDSGGGGGGDNTDSEGETSSGVGDTGTGVGPARFVGIAQNQYAPKVHADLRTICPDPGLKIDPAGEVSYSQTMSSVGCDTLALLQQVGTVAIRGEDPYWSPGPGESLGGSGIQVLGVTEPVPGTRIVDIIYDATECNGRGFVTVDQQGVLIKLPSDVLLFHELAHAARILLGIASANLAQEEQAAIDAENAYRSAVGLPLRGEHAGGCAGSHSALPYVDGYSEPKPDAGAPDMAAPEEGASDEGSLEEEASEEVPYEPNPDPGTP